MGIVLQLSNVRLSYPKLEKPDYFTPGVASRPDEKRRWSAAFHIDPKVSLAQRVTGGKLAGPKGNAKDMVDAALIDVSKELWEKKWELKHGNLLVDPKGCCWQDGKRKEVPGVWILSTHRTEDKGRPKVVDTDLAPIYKDDGTVYPEKAGRLYSGMYVNAQIEIWAQAKPEGLRGALLIIQRLRDGDAFSGGAAPNLDTMEAIEEGAGADDLS